ncbi:hypothetical protein RU97_GL000907 [Enterococcus canis]|uniref:Uncharacterized protein n=1 Tax=Enterococcus canis TaxID=214095 RepID=A0A1L8RHU9_9ENTE|nr:hypothetical protein [Enterococcus canis]OJG19336.1 hypothetical protein RU97_GL000907 [Enterococcus canis]
MKSIRRAGALFVVLFIGIFLGTLGWQTALLLIAPLLLIWMFLWDERRYDYTKVKREQNDYRYHDVG